MKIQKNVKLSAGLSLILSVAFFVAGFGSEWFLDNISGYLLVVSATGAVIQLVFIFSVSRFWKLVPISGLIIAILSTVYFGIVMQLTGITW